MASAPSWVHSTVPGTERAADKHNEVHARCSLRSSEVSITLLQNGILHDILILTQTQNCKWSLTSTLIPKPFANSPHQDFPAFSRINFICYTLPDPLLPSASIHIHTHLWKVHGNYSTHIIFATATGFFLPNSRSGTFFQASMHVDLPHEFRPP